MKFPIMQNGIYQCGKINGITKITLTPV